MLFVTTLGCKKGFGWRVFLCDESISLISRCRVPVCRMPGAGCRCRMPGAGCRVPGAGARCRLLVAGAGCWVLVPVAGCRKTKKLYYAATGYLPHLSILSTSECYQ